MPPSEGEKSSASDEVSRRVVALDLRDAQQLGPRSGPLSRVCGLPALERTMLVLGRRGYGHALVLVRPADRELVEQMMRRLPGSGIRVSWIEDGTRELGFWPVIEALTAEEPPVSDVLYWPGALSFGRFAPKIVDRTAPRDGAAVGVHATRPDSVGPMVISLGALQASPDSTPHQLEQQLAAEGKLEGVELDLEPILLRDPIDTRRATSTLLASLRKKEDGVVAHFDRHISLAVSRHLMKIQVHPHAATIAAAVAGAVCGVLAAQGGYVYLLLGALLFQLNSILDGIDGELARAKLLESRTGQWMDTLSDDFSNTAFVLGAGIGCYRTWDSTLYLVLGIVAAAGFVINAVIMYRYLLTRTTSGDLNAVRMPWEQHSRLEKAYDASPEPQQPPRPTLAQRLEPLVRRDFFVLLTTFLALVGQLRIMMFFFALGATVVWVSILAYPLFKRSGTPA